MPDLSIRTSMDVGPAKVRRRLTANVEPLSVQFNLTGTQLALLREFYTDSTLGGALPFDFKDPETGTTQTFRFTAAPKYSGKSPRSGGAGLWSVSIELERMPAVEEVTGPGGGTNPPVGFDFTPFDAFADAAPAALEDSFGHYIPDGDDPGPAPDIAVFLLGSLDQDSFDLSDSEEALIGTPIAPSGGGGGGGGGGGVGPGTGGETGGEGGIVGNT